MTAEQINEINAAVHKLLTERIPNVAGFGVVVYFAPDQVQLITPFPNKHEMYGFVLNTCANLAQMAVGLYADLHGVPQPVPPISKYN